MIIDTINDTPLARFAVAFIRVSSHLRCVAFSCSQAVGGLRHASGRGTEQVARRPAGAGYVQPRIDRCLMPASAGSARNRRDV